MKTYPLTIFCWFILLSFTTRSQTLIDESVFGISAMANDLFIFEDGSRIIIENNLENCTLYNLKYLDNSGQLIYYKKGQFRDKPSAYLLSGDSLEIITIGDGHDVPFITSILRTVYYANSGIPIREDTIYTLEDDQFITGFTDGKRTYFDGENILMLTESGELYWNSISMEFSLRPIYEFDRYIVADHLSFGYGQEESELLVNFYEQGWLYHLHFRADTEVTIDSIALGDVVDIDKIDDGLIVISKDTIRLFSRDLNELSNYPVGTEVEFVNIFNNKVYFKLPESEVVTNHSRVSVDIAVFDIATMVWTDTLSIQEGPQVFHKVMLMDSVVHILGSYIENNQAVVQRHSVIQTDTLQSKVSDLEIVGYSIVSSSLTQWQSNPPAASAALKVTFKKSDLKPNDNVLHLAKVGTFSPCRPYIMDVFQNIVAEDEFFDITIHLNTSNIREDGDSLIARFNCSLFLPHGSPLNQNLDKNTLCPEVKFPITVSTKSTEAEKLFNVFPNPVTDELFLKFDPKNHLAAGNYQIYSNLGTLIDSGTLKADNISIDTRALAPGIYTLIFFNDNIWGSRTFMKQ